MRAARFGVFGFACGLLAQFVLLEQSRLSPAWALLAGLLPIQIGACGAAGLSLLADTEPGSGLSRFGLRRPGRPLFAAVLRTLCWLYPVVMLVTLVSAALWSACGLAPPEHPLMVLLSHDRGLAVWLTLACVAAVVAPVTEEILFRLILHDALAVTRVRRPGVWTSFFFALVHLQPVQMPGLFILALVLQHQRQQTRGLWASLFTHLGFNLISLLFIGVYWMMKDAGQAPVDMVMGLWMRAG